MIVFFLRRRADPGETRSEGLEGAGQSTAGEDSVVQMEGDGFEEWRKVG
jgi:hypothetical protein